MLEALVVWVTWGLLVLTVIAAAATLHYPQGHPRQMAVGLMYGAIGIASFLVIGVLATPPGTSWTLLSTPIILILAIIVSMLILAMHFWTADCEKKRN